MGLETAAVIGIIGAVTAAAGTGAAVYQSQQAGEQAKKTEKNQEGALAAQRAEMAAKNSQADAEEQALSARARQRALAASSSGSTYGGTLRTTPLGVSSPPQVSQRALLGL